MKNLKYIVTTIFLTLGLSISAQNLLAAWIVPSDEPPDQVISMPINVGTTAQSKDGPLVLNHGDVGTVGLFVEHGDVGVGVAAPTSKLDVDGKIRMRTQTQASDAGDTVTTKDYVDFKSSTVKTCTDGVDCPNDIGTPQVGEMWLIQ